MKMSCVSDVLRYEVTATVERAVPSRRAQEITGLVVTEIISECCKSGLITFTRYKIR